MATNHSRILWLEGMTLDPHHFQQWDRFQTYRLQARIRAVTAHYWGFASLAVDEDRLKNGEFALTACEGVMPDGFVFSLPGDGRLPVARAVSEAFDPSLERLDVYLCLPALRSGSNLQRSDASQAELTRYTSEPLSISDENTGHDERTMEVADPNFQIRFGHEQLDGYSTLQVAAVVRSPGGYFSLDQRHIPTSLTLKASGRLGAVASKVLELCLAKSGSLDERRLATAGQRQLTPSDITAIGLLAAVNRHLPLFRNFAAGAGCHPERLYLSMLELGGELSAYTADPSFHPREFPVYDHANLTGCVNDMMAAIERALGGAQPSQHYRQVPLTTIRENLLQAEVTEDELSRADFIVSAKSSDIPESRLASELPSMLRVASPEMIDSVLQSYTRALVVEHTSRIPVGMPEDPLASYFRLERSGPFWDGIRESRKLAIFIPAEFSAVELKLAAVLRG